MNNESLVLLAAWTMWLALAAGLTAEVLRQAKTRERGVGPVFCSLSTARWSTWGAEELREAGAAEGVGMPPSCWPHLDESIVRREGRPCAVGQGDPA